jgi:small ligand-binding sensory domain FIST
MRPETLTARVGTGLSIATDAEQAGREAARDARDSLASGEVDLAFLFLSAAHLDDAEVAAHAVREELAPRTLLGCVADGVVAGDREVEDGPGAAVWAGSLPGAEVASFHAAVVEAGDAVAIVGMPELEQPALVAMLADPFTFPVGPFLARLNALRPGLPIVGGLAAGGGRPGAQALIADDEVHRAGMVGAVVSGVPVTTVVSQGCAAIGREAVITSAEGNVVYELAGERALDRVRADLEALPLEQQQLAAQGLLVGLVIDENRAEYGPDDYLMRGLLAIDEETGALTVGEQVRVGQTLRLHVRDAGAADADLRALLAQALPRTRAAGALMFTCNGRGTNMFREPHHDARVTSSALGRPAVAGFFCGGEIGPVGGQAFLHGFTATLAVFLED